MPSIQIDMRQHYTREYIDAYPGRSNDAKRRLNRAILSRLGMLDIPASDVLILLREVAGDASHDTARIHGVCCDVASDLRYRRSGKLMGIP
jgi:hypothetical protein